MVLSLQEGELPEENGQAPEQDPAFGGQAGFAGPGQSPGGRGGRSRAPVKLLDQFDENDDGYLNKVERTNALVHLESQDGPTREEVDDPEEADLVADLEGGQRGKTNPNRGRH